MIMICASMKFTKKKRSPEAAHKRKIKKLSVTTGSTGINANSTHARFSRAYVVRHVDDTQACEGTGLAVSIRTYFISQKQKMKNAVHLL